MSLAQVPVRKIISIAEREQTAFEIMELVEEFNLTKTIIYYKKLGYRKKAIMRMIELECEGIHSTLVPLIQRAFKKVYSPRFVAR